MHRRDHRQDVRSRTWRRAGTGATEDTRHFPMARYDIGGHGIRWQLGWDETGRTFYAFRLQEATGGAWELVEAFGAGPGEHPSIESLEEAVGLPIPAEIRAGMAHDHAHPAPGGCRRGGWGR